MKNDPLFRRKVTPGRFSTGVIIRRYTCLEDGWIVTLNLT